MVYVLCSMVYTSNPTGREDNLPYGTKLQVSVTPKYKVERCMPRLHALHAAPLQRLDEPSAGPEPAAASSRGQRSSRLCRSPAAAAGGRRRATVDAVPGEVATASVARGAARHAADLHAGHKGGSDGSKWTPLGGQGWGEGGGCGRARESGVEARRSSSRPRSRGRKAGFERAAHRRRGPEVR